MRKRTQPESPLLAETKRLCDRYHIVPSRSKGQNFLVDEDAYDEMIAAADLPADAVVLEVGPGLGFLTERLAARTQKVIAVELDTAIVPALNMRLKERGMDSVSVFNEDVMNFTGRWADEARAAGEHLAVVTNLPYNISSIFLRKFIGGNEGGIAPGRLTIMLQKEVAERIVAQPGSMSILAVSVQFYADAEIRAVIPASSFWPMPVIASAVITFTRQTRMMEELSRAGISEKDFFRLVKIGFSARRKMLKANLAGGLRIPLATASSVLERAGIDLSARPQELSVNDWLKIIVGFSAFMV